MDAIATLDEQHGEAVAVVRVFYLRARGVSVGAVAEALGITVSTLERRRLMGERALLVWVRATSTAGIE